MPSQGRPPVSPSVHNGSLLGYCRVPSDCVNCVRPQSVGRSSLPSFFGSDGVQGHGVWMSQSRGSCYTQLTGHEARCFVIRLPASLFTRCRGAGRTDR